MDHEFTRSYLTEQIDHIDASMFTGDAFQEPENRAALREFMARWEREMILTEKSLEEELEDDEEGTEVTIKSCVECKHHNGASPEAAWYDHRCHHPGVKLDSAPNPVTGKPGFKSKNDLGMVVIKDNPYPNCRKINTDGKCDLYKGK